MNWAKWFLLNGSTIKIMHKWCAKNQKGGWCDENERHNRIDSNGQFCLKQFVLWIINEDPNIYLFQLYKFITYFIYIICYVFVCTRRLRKVIQYTMIDNNFHFISIRMCEITNTHFILNANKKKDEIVLILSYFVFSGFLYLCLFPLDFQSFN